MSSGASFLNEFNTIVGKNKDKLDLFAKKVLYKFSERLVANTPVKTGLLRGSWNISVGGVAPYSGSPEPGAYTLGVASPETLTRLNAVISSISYGSQVYIANHASYARLVHDGGPGRVPQPFVTVTVAMAPLILQEALAEIPK